MTESFGKREKEFKVYFSINEYLETGNEELNRKCQREERRLKNIYKVVHCMLIVYILFLKARCNRVRVIYSARYNSIRKFDGKI